MKTYIIHAAHLTERAASIRRQLDPLGLDYEFVTRYDKDELTEEVMAKWFVKDIRLHPSELSCAMKHIYVCQKIVENNLEGALVFEDDIVLHNDFKDVFQKSLQELSLFPNGAYLLSYEDSTLQFIPKSRRIKGKMLYEGDSIRCLGAYYITIQGAKTVLDKLSEGKVDCPIDHFYQGLLNAKTLKTLWCHPCVATQGSSMGLFSSSLRKRKHRLMQARWYIKLWYKKFLFYIR